MMVRKRDAYTFMCMYICIYMYIHTHICLHNLILFWYEEWGILLNRGRCMLLSRFIWMALSCQPLSPMRVASIARL